MDGGGGGWFAAPPSTILLQGGRGVAVALLPPMGCCLLVLLLLLRLLLFPLPLPLPLPLRARARASGCSYSKRDGIATTIPKFQFCPSGPPTTELPPVFLLRAVFTFASSSSPRAVRNGRRTRPPPPPRRRAKAKDNRIHTRSTLAELRAPSHRIEGVGVTIPRYMHPYRASAHALLALLLSSWRHGR